MTERDPREQALGRILDRGPAALTDAELLAVLLRKPRAPEQAMQEKAESLLSMFGGVAGLVACDLQMARAQKIGELQIANLLAAVELSRRLHGKPEKADLAGDKEAMAAYLAARFGRPGQQVLGAFFVGHDEETLDCFESFRGTAKDIQLDTKTILREALCRDASGIFMFHIFSATKAMNQGEAARFGRQMLEAGELLGIELIDYLLIGPKNWVSLREKRPW